MGARQKLNMAYFTGSLIVAALIGMVVQSWSFFLVALRRRIGMQESPLSSLIPAALVVAVLCALLVKGGWVISLPILLVLFVVGLLASASRR
jgi:hypothetical protein